jgi:hypothetical protein
MPIEAALGALLEFGDARLPVTPTWDGAIDRDNLLQNMCGFRWSLFLQRT